MGDTSDQFKNVRGIKLSERLRTEAKLVNIAMQKLGKIATLALSGTENFIKIFLDGKQIDFWPYAGWFCGRKPIGNVKGRGLTNLIKEIKKIKGREDGKNQNAICNR